MRKICMLLLLGGCNDGLLSDYTLNLEPIVPKNQNPFKGAPATALVITDSLGNVDAFVVDGEESGTIEFTNMPALNSAFVGLLLYDESQILEQTFQAFGQAGPFDLSVGDGEIDTTLFVANHLSVGTLGALSESRIGAAAVITSMGDTFLFGGVATPSSPVASSEILKMSPLDDGDWTFQKVGTIQDPEGLEVPLVGAEAILVEVDGQELIYVVGGTQNIKSLALDPPTNFLFDPMSAEIVWWPSSTSGKPEYTKYEPYIAQLSNGEILTISTDYTPNNGGGWSIPTTGPSIEVFSPTQKEHTKRLPSVDHPYDGFAVVELPFQQSHLMCGGSKWFQPQGQEGYMKPQRSCSVVSEQLELTTWPDLPVAEENDLGLSFHSIIVLDDASGTLLLTGGVKDEVRTSMPATALSTAWLMRDPGPNGTWERVGDLNYARASHRMVPTPEGGAIIFGGATAMAPGYPRLFQSVSCPEYFDPESKTFSVLEPCEPAGAGPDPTFATHPDHEMILVGDRTSSGGGGEFATLPVEGPRSLDWSKLAE